MAKLSLFEVLDSQLNQVPELDGQLIVVTNTGSIYRDVLINGSINRLLIGNDIIVVDELPLAPISNKIYFLRPNQLYTYNSGWIELNKQGDFINRSEMGAVGGVATLDNNGKLLDSQLPDSFGGTFTQIQADYEQTDSTQVDFIKNKPFGDNLPVTERFSQAETPNPVSCGSEILGLTGYKVSGTILTQEQMMKGVNVTTNGVTENFLSGEMQMLGGIAVLITLPSGYMYATFKQTGEMVVNPEHGISINVPETGSYFLLPYGTPLPEGLTIELEYIGTKKIDPKYLPNNYNKPAVSSSGVKVIEVLNEMLPGGESTTTFDVDELEAAINNDEYFVIKIIISIEAFGGGRMSMMMSPSYLGTFYTIAEMSILTMDYDIALHEFTAFNAFDLSSLVNGDSTTTYGLRNNKPSFAEQIIAWAQKRGLI